MEIAEFLGSGCGCEMNSILIIYHYSHNRVLRNTSRKDFIVTLKTAHFSFVRVSFAKKKGSREDFKRVIPKDLKLK